MSHAHSTFSLLDQMSSSQAERRTYVDILFSGFESSVSDGLLSLLRGSGLSPRGRVVNNKLELIEALGDRSWDMLFAYSADNSTLTPEEICQTLHAESRELPVIQLATDPNYDDQQVAIQMGVAFLLPEQADDLIVTRATQLFERQRQNRRLHKLELGLEQLAKLNRRLSEESTLAVAAIQDHNLVEPNATFESLFQLDARERAAIALNRVFTEESQKSIESTLKTSTASLHETMLLRDSKGAEFSARVELYPATPDRPQLRPLYIDPMALSNIQTESPVDQDGLLTEAEFVQKLENSLHKASAGGHDAFLLYFDVATVPLTTDPALISRVKQALLKQLTPLRQFHTLTILENLKIAVLIDNADRDVAKSFAQTVQNKLSRSQFRCPAGVTSVSLGLGISSINDNSPAARELLLRAESSVRPLGGQTGAQTAFTNPVQQQMKVDSATKELEEAIANHQLKLLYQPLVSLSEANVERSYEVLVRMSGGPNQDKLPAQFLSSLEHARVMVKLDRWVVENSLMELQRQIGPGRGLKIYINLARRTLKSRSFTPWFANLMDELSLSGNFITIELSESDVAADIENALLLCEQLREKSISICIKHFGCSTSSDKVYARIKPDFIKIDGAFIEELEYPDRGPRTIKRLLEPVERDKTKVIAPLIEDAAMLPELYRMGFDLVQGYYLQPPQEEMRYEYFQ